MRPDQSALSQLALTGDGRVVTGGEDGAGVLRVCWTAAAACGSRNTDGEIADWL